MPFSAPPTAPTVLLSAPPTAPPTLPTVPLRAPPTAPPTVPTVPFSVPPTAPPTLPTVPTVPFSAPPTAPTVLLSAPPTALPTLPTVPLRAPPTAPPTLPTVPFSAPPTAPTVLLSVPPTAPPTLPTVPLRAPPTALPTVSTVPLSAPPTALPAAPTALPTSPPTPSALFCAATVAWPASFRLRSATTSWPFGACTRTLPAAPASNAAVIARSWVSPGSSSLAGSVIAAVAFTWPWASIWWPATFSFESSAPSTEAFRPRSAPAGAPLMPAAAFAPVSIDATCAPPRPMLAFARTSAASLGTATCFGAVFAASLTCTEAGSTSRTTGSDAVLNCRPTRASALIAGLLWAWLAAAARATSASTLTGIGWVYLAARACRSRSD